MKKILYIFSILTSTIFFSCTSVDNYDEPNAILSGNVMDSITGKSFITGQAESSIRLWEMSWSDNPTPQDIPIKQDGTYNDTKLFGATYDMQPYGGAFWPAQRQTGITLKGSLKKDFKVIPYLYVTDVTSQLVGTTLKLTCKLKAPVTQNLPRVLEIRPFVSLTQFCGAGSRIDEYNLDKYKLDVNNNWWDGVGDMSTGVGSITYVLPDLPLKSGRTFYVRIGVRVEDTYRQYNYSDIITVQVP